MKPLSMDHYLAKELVIELIDSPEAMTYVGIFDRFSWLTKHSSKLSIPTESDRNEDISELEDRLKILQSYPAVMCLDFFQEIQRVIFVPA